MSAGGAARRRAARVPAAAQSGARYMRARRHAIAMAAASAARAKPRRQPCHARQRRGAAKWRARARRACVYAAAYANLPCLCCCAMLFCRAVVCSFVARQRRGGAARALLQRVAQRRGEAQYDMQRRCAPRRAYAPVRARGAYAGACAARASAAQRAQVRASTGVASRRAAHDWQVEQVICVVAGGT